MVDPMLVQLLPSGAGSCNGEQVSRKLVPWGAGGRGGGQRPEGRVGEMDLA